MPGCAWHCQPVENCHTISVSGVPAEFEVVATQSGRPVDGSPFHLSGMTLVRLGADAMARYICEELPSNAGHPHHRFGSTWDQLAEY